MDKQNDDLNTQKLNATENAADKENTNTENGESNASKNLKTVIGDMVAKSPETVGTNDDDVNDEKPPETKSDKVGKSNEEPKVAQKNESGDVDVNIKEDESHHAESSNDNCTKDSSKEKTKNEDENLSLSGDDKEVVKAKNKNENENLNSESSSISEEIEAELSTTKKRDKLDSSSSLDEMVDPLVTTNDDATKDHEEDEDECKDLERDETMSAVNEDQKEDDESKNLEQDETSAADEDQDEDVDESKNLEHDESTSAVNEDSEGEFEDVEIPEEVDELIVPDEGEDLTNPGDGDADGDEDHDSDRQENPSNDEEITKDSEPAVVEDETSNSKSPDDEESNDANIESELVAIEETPKDSSSCEGDQTKNDADIVSNNTTKDPLNCLVETTQQSAEDDTNNSENVQAEGETNSEANQEDDDDVEFIETRNSPICIESDEEDSRETESSVGKQTNNVPKATITVSKNLMVTRTSARKSTARSSYCASPSPQTVPPPHSSGKTKSLPHSDKATTYRRSLPSGLTVTRQPVMDTIDLLDSSDDDSAPATNRSSTHNLRTPPKRTLMAAKNQNNKGLNKTPLPKRSALPSNFSTHIKIQPKKPAPPPLPPPTPQSNFLNNVQLQPATSGCNPPAFSALLSNKSVIIPNAFYGNHPSIRGNPADIEMERRYARWLENFITQFCNPQLVASHSCFVFLQRSLKYKDFVRIKGIRTNLNVNAQKATDQLNHQLMLDLRAIFLKSSKEITPHGRRFCEMACSTPQNKTVTLLIHASTSRIIMKSCNMEVPIAIPSSSSTSNNTTNSSTATRKRQLDEDEYVPDKIKFKSSSENGDDDEESRKRSLRSKRAKRLDNSFSYNEDDLAEYDIDDEEEAERSAQAEVQRKIEQKRLEAQRQRQQQAKSFESAFIQAFAKGLDGKELNKNKQTSAAGNSKAGQRARLNNNSLTSASVQQHLANNDAEDLLQATWIENVENEETQTISDDEEPKQHRIYKQMQLQKQYQHQVQLHRSTPKHSVNSTRRDNYQYQQELCLDARQWPKNTEIHLHAISKNKDICVICKLNVQRIVHHYVNEHRGCEVYNSRLTSSQVEHLRRGASNIFNVSLYKNGQPQYEAHCIFCQKLSKFMLPYWIHHFTMHTGEYAYRCSGCGIRKPTRSLLTQHISQGCAHSGTVLQDYTHDTSKIRVEARICTLCNYVQLHRCNIVKHLHQQHGIKQILPKHIQTIVLLKLDVSTESAAPPARSMPQQTERVATRSTRQPSIQPSFASSSSYDDNTYVIDDDDDDDDDTLLFGDSIPSIQDHQQREIDPNAQNYSYNYIPPYMRNAANNINWEENNPAEDLSYMICGMLDVQTNSD